VGTELVGVATREEGGEGREDRKEIGHLRGESRGEQPGAPQQKVGNPHLVHL